MTSRGIIGLICGLLATVEAQSILETFRSQDSVVFTQLDPDEDKASVEFVPAGPSDQNLDGDTLSSTVLVYTSKGVVGEYSGMIASYDADKVWFNDPRRETLTEYSIDTNDVIRASTHRTHGLEHLAYDRVTKILYWSDSFEKSVFATGPSDYKHFTPVWKSSVVAPYALAVHTTKRKLFFGVYKTDDTKFSQSKLLRSDLDGSNVRAILSYPDVIRPHGLTVDFSGKADRLFWIDINSLEKSVVMSCNLNGKLRREFFSSPSGLFWDIAIYRNYIYITDFNQTAGSQYNIHIRWKNGRRGRTVKTKLRPRNIGIYAKNEVSQTRVTNECDNSQCQHLCLASQRESHVCKCSPGYRLVDGFKCETDPLLDDYLLICDLGQERVFQVPLKKSPFSVKSITALPWDEVSGSERIEAVTVDMKNGDIAWANPAYYETIHWGEKRMAYGEEVTSIAVDCCKEKIYWAGIGEIVSWDGRSLIYERIYALPFISDTEIRQITIDCFKKRIYWVEYDSATLKSTVKRSSVDGKDVETVLMNLPTTRGIMIDYETYTLYVMARVDGVLYALPLILLKDSIPSVRPTHWQYTSIDLAAHLDYGFVAIQDITIKNGYVYLADSESSFIRRFNLRKGPQSMERYGPMSFHFTYQLDFYDKQYHDRFIRPNCTGSSQSEETTTIYPSTSSPQSTSAAVSTTQSCDAILLKSDDTLRAVKAYIACVFGNDS